MQALQARVAALESEQNTKVSSILHADTSDPMADADLVMASRCLSYLLRCQTLRLPELLSASMLPEPIKASIFLQPPAENTAVLAEDNNCCLPRPQKQQHGGI